MTDRWKDALRDLDDVGPDESVYRRAAQGPTRSDLPPPPNRLSRIVAGLTAFAVFAVAAVFAWNAFRPESVREGPVPRAVSVAPMGEDGSILWPERTSQALASLQEGADAGRGRTRWLLDPADVADEFVTRVLGWPFGTYEVGLESRTDGVMARVVRAPCQGSDPGSPADACAFGAREDILLAQPVAHGVGGIWAVVSVAAPTFALLDVVPGQTVVNGESVEVHLAPSVELPVVVGSRIGGSSASGNCSGVSGTERLRTDDGRISVSIGSDRDVGTDCGASAPGYAWVATATWDIHAGADPLMGDSTPYVAVTAVPLAVAIPENAAPAGLSTYVDPLGWRVDYPAAWTVTPIATQDHVSTTGAVFSNVTPGVASPNASTPSPVGLDPGTMPLDAVEVVITHREGGPPPDLLSDDSRFPVTLDGLGCPFDSMLLCGVGVRGNGLDYAIEVRRGANASPEDIAAVEALVASMRFRSLDLGAQVNDWTSLGRPRLYPEGVGTATWVGGRLGVVYVMRGPGGTYALDLDPDACGEGENQTWDPTTLQIWIQCPAYLGTGDVRYDRFGRPDPGNAPAFRSPLRAHPVITAWDGSLLISTSRVMEELPQRSWP